MSVEAAQEFWRWFTKNQRRFRNVEVPEKEALLDEIQEHLHEYCPDLYFEIGGMPGETTELIITAEGKQALFALVEDLIARAPALEGWSFIAFKPPHGFDFVTRYGRATVDPETCWFLPLESPSEPNRVGLRVGCPNYDATLKSDFGNAVLVVLDTALGELRAAREIAGVEVVAAPQAPEDEGFIELVELARYLDWWMARRSGPKSS
jgi:hypothetical protein